MPRTRPPEANGPGPAAAASTPACPPQPPRRQRDAGVIERETDASLFGESQEEREQFVQARLTRQQVLTRDDPLQFWAILSEGALRQLVGGREIMQAQLRSLIEVSNDRANVTLQVLPFAAGAHAATSGPFVIMKFPEAPDLGVVYLEGQTGGIYLESADEVARYTLVCEHLRASALSTVATVRLIEEVAEDL